MIHHHGVLNNLLDQFVHQVEILCGNSLYVKNMTGRVGVYKYPSYKGRVINIIKRTQKDKDFPHCPLPHLKIVTGMKLARKAGVKPDLVLQKRWHDRDAAYWCISISNNAQFDKVANEISRLYHYV